MARCAAHRLAAGLCGLLLTISPVVQAASFTPQQRAEIVAILREALRSDPSILRDAMQTLQADEAVRRDEATRAAIARNRNKLLADPADPVAGNPAGNVTVVEFYDTRCPYCRRMAPTLDALLKAEPDIRLVYKDLPVLGAASLLEARALLAAQRQDGYAKLQAMLMQASTPSTPESIRALADKLGLNGSRLLLDMDDPVIRARLNANLELAHDLGVQGTPAIVIGDQLIPGAAELAYLRLAVTAVREPSGASAK